jgi:hypothetical protein
MSVTDCDRAWSNNLKYTHRNLTFSKERLKNDRFYKNAWLA